MRRVGTLIALVLALAGCASTQRLSGAVGPVNATTAPSATRTPQVAYVPYKYDQSQGNTTGTLVQMMVPNWPQSSGAPRRNTYDPTGQILLRLDFTQNAGTAKGNWITESQTFAGEHPSYRQIGDISDVSCPPGATDCANWEFTFDQNGVTRQVIDRGIVSSSIGFAVYISAPVALFPEAQQIFNHIIATVRVG